MANFEDECVTRIGRAFRTFGGGEKPVTGNPIAAALQDTPYSFAAGVDVRDVVKSVLLLERRRVRRLRIEEKRRNTKKVEKILKIKHARESETSN